jgi:hypothetical protein
VKAFAPVQKPGPGEFNLGGLTGAVVGSLGGLFAVGLARAILSGHIADLFGTPILGIIGFLVSGVTGWLLGSQLGPRLGQRFHSQQVEMIGGAIGGLVPAALIALWGWYMVTPH